MGQPGLTGNFKGYEVIAFKIGILVWKIRQKLIFTSSKSVGLKILGTVLQGLNLQIIKLFE